MFFCRKSLSSVLPEQERVPSHKCSCEHTNIYFYFFFFLSFCFFLFFFFFFFFYFILLVAFWFPLCFSSLCSLVSEIALLCYSYSDYYCYCYFFKKNPKIGTETLWKNTIRRLRTLTARLSKSMQKSVSSTFWTQPDKKSWETKKPRVNSTVSDCFD